MSNKYYAIAKGHQPGIYTSWYDAEKQINGFSNPVFMRTYDKQDAEDFMARYQNHHDTKTLMLDDAYQKKVNTDASMHLTANFKTNPDSLEKELWIALQFIDHKHHDTKITKRLKVLEKDLKDYPKKNCFSAEVVATMVGINQAKRLGFKSLLINYHYSGIYEWTSFGNWQAKSSISQDYSLFINQTDLALAFNKVDRFDPTAAMIDLELKKLLDQQ